MEYGSARQKAVGQDCTWTWSEVTHSGNVSKDWIDNILIYIYTTRRFQRTLRFQVTINFVYEILKHFKASCKGSEKHSSQI